MRIIFFRHGIAADRLDHQSEADRPLTVAGIEKTKRVAAGLAKLIDSPAVILTSPKLRARQTADLLGRQMRVEPRIVNALGAGRAESMIEVLAELQRSGSSELPGVPGVPGAGACVVVGHEPDLSEAIEMLLTGQTLERLELKKAGAACVETTGPIRWGEPCAKLLWLVTPGMWQ
ncbi:MAG: histidine phosphatase family protein [Phycisphaeraceae bacterium]